MDESPTMFGSPSTRRRAINQSPAPPEPEQLKYRTPPSTPFQPGFYKKPQANVEEVSNLFPLSPKQLRKEKSSDSITSSSSSSKKLRRKKIEAQRLEMSDDESDTEAFKEN